MNFTAEYQLSFEEFNEAALALEKHFKKTARVSSVPNRHILGWILFIGLAITFFLLLKNQQQSPKQSAPSPPSPDLFPLLHPFWPWVVLFFVAWIYSFFWLRRSKRTRLQKFWDGSPALHQVRTIQIDDEGMTLTVATAGTRSIWAHYIQFEETPRLFLLFASEHSAEFIPKRIFTNPTDIDAFRELLLRNIGPATKAFPVIPIAPENSEQPIKLNK